MKALLIASDPLTTQIRNLGIGDWDSLVHFVQSLPYGRNTIKTDLSRVLSERRGTCSSKHAFLKKVADVNNLPNIDLILGIYKMNSENTPGIGDVLDAEKIAYLPEAHCYLSIQGECLDVTTPNSNIRKIQNDLLEEQKITPEQVSYFKEDYHKAFLNKWLQKRKLPLTFEELWDIREACIAQLSQNSITPL